MADLERVLPEQARTLLEAGYVYVDARSEPEFEQGHVPGAFNVPLMHRGPAGLVDNPEFLSVMQSAFSRDERLVVGCRTGSRSLRAATLLVQAGFEKVVDLRTGWEGSRDAFGRPEPGWRPLGLPSEAGKPEGQAYDDVRRRSPR